MAGITLSILLDKPDKTYEGGEIITGQVKVSVTEKIETVALMIVLYCKGFSKAKNINRTIEKVKDEIILFKGSWIPKEYVYPFEIVSPLGPRTYKGNIFDVTWHIGTKVRSSQGKDITAESEISLLSGKRKSNGDESIGSKEVVHSQSPKNLMGCFSFSLILTFAGIYIAWMVSFFGIIPMILGFALLFLTTYQALVNKRIKKIEVKLGSRHASPGEKISFSIIFEANIPFKIDKVSATLRGNEIVDFFRSTHNKKYLKHRLYENRQELPFAAKTVPTNVPVRIEGEVLIPEGVPCSIDLIESGKGMALSWEIEFVIEMKKWPDWVYFEDIAVLP
ncbi:MAG: hypothetical protein R6V76_00965 [Desulfobacterales bacterium]